MYIIQAHIWCQYVFIIISWEYAVNQSRLGLIKYEIPHDFYLDNCAQTQPDHQLIEDYTCVMHRPLFRLLKIICRHARLVYHQTLPYCTSKFSREIWQIRISRHHTPITAKPWVCTISLILMKIIASLIEDTSISQRVRRWPATPAGIFFIWLLAPKINEMFDSF